MRLLFVRYYLVFSIIGILYSGNAKSSIYYNVNCKLAYENALGFHFDKMDSILRVEQNQHPDNTVIISIQTTASFLKYISSEKEAYYTEFENNYDIAIEKLDKESDSEPYKLYLLTDLYLQSAFVNSLRSNFFTALIHFKKAYNHIHENYKKFPDFVPNKKAIGLMNIAVGSIPKSYNWTLQLLGLEGDLKTGNMQLQDFMNICEYSKDFNYMFIESLAVYSFTHTNYSNKKKSTDLLSNIFSDTFLAKKYTNNQTYTFTKVSFYQHVKQNEKALQALSEIQQEFASNPNKIYYLDYMYGESLLFKNKAKSKMYFSRYLDYYPGKNYLKAAHHKLSWAYLLENNIDEYTKENKLITEGGNDLFDADKQAEKEADRDVMPNVYLLKSRLLFDGGYYIKADSVLRYAYLKGEFVSNRSKLEYIYRLARIYDELDSMEIAKAYYKMAIEKGRDLPYYYAANSALNLGYQYEKAMNFVEAKKMYHLCLDLDFDEYQNSITQKAKAGLNRIEKR